MPGVADAVFTEVLEIQVDASSFVDGLAQLESAYDDFVERVNAKGLGAGNVIQVAQFSELQDQFGSLEGALSDFAAATTAAMDSLDSKLNQVAADAAKAGQAVVDAKAAAAQSDSGSSGSAVTGLGLGASIGNFQGFLSGLTGANNTLTQMLGNVARFKLMWSAVGAAIDAVTAVIKAPFEAIAAGFTYLQQLQDASAQLQGAIAANVKFSSDFAENFRLAGQAATQVEQELEQLSTAMGVPLEQLRTTFTDLLEAGAMHFESSLQGAVNLTKELTIAIMATSTSAQAARLALSEIPKLLDGSITGQSRILTTLHMSVAEWDAMLQSAQKNGDLDAELVDKLAPYLDVVTAASTRQTALTNAITLQGERITGAIALPLWQDWIAILQTVEGYLLAHGQAIAASAGNAVKLGEELGRLIEYVWNWLQGTQAVEAIFEMLNQVVQFLIMGLRSVIDLVAGTAKSVTSLLEVALDPSKIFDKAAWQKAWDEIAQQGKETLDSLQRNSDDYVSAVYGKGPVQFNNGPDLLNQKVAPNSPLVDPNAERIAKQDFTELQEQYRAELDATKEKWKEVQDDINNSQQTGVVTAATAVSQRVAAFKSEQAELDKLIQKYKDAADASQLNNDSLDQKASAQVKKFEDQLELEQSKDNRTSTQGERSAVYKGNEEAFQAIQENYRNEIDKTKAAFADAEKDIKSAQDAGTISSQQATGRRIASMAEELATINQIIGKYTELAQQSGANPQNVQKFVDGLSTVGQTASGSTKSGITAANATQDKTEEETTQKHLEALRTMEVQHAQTMLAIYKQEASEGLHTKVQVFDQEVAASKIEHAAIIADLNAELAAAGENAAQRSAINDRITAEDQRYTEQHATDTQKRIALAHQEATERQNVADKLREVTLQLEATENSGAALHGRTTAQQAAATKELAAEYVKLRDAQVDAAQAALIYAQVAGQDTTAIDQLVIKLKEAENALAEAENAKSTADSKTAGGEASEKIFGSDSIGDAFSGFSRSVESLGNAFKFFSTTASGLENAIKSGYQQGGVLGAIGGAAGQIGSMIGGPVGAIVGGVGDLFSFIGNLFTAAAEKVAKDVQTATSRLMQQYSNGTATLSQTITALEQERNQAIQQLSGMKDAQKQLDQLLPSLDDQINQLLSQQKLTLTQFENQAAALHLQSSTLSSVLTQWEQINQQVQSYIGAGGSVATAQQFLSDSLQQLATSTQASLEQGQQQAIQDAQSLNQLLIQRVQLAQQYAQQEFALKNGDSIERANNTALNAALTYQQQKAQNDQNLQNLDSQISLMTTRVSMESQVFNIASSTAGLQNQSNALNIEQLATQIQQWKDMQTIINSIYKNPDGTYGTNNSTIFPAATNPNMTGPVSLVGNQQVTGGSIDSMFNAMLERFNNGDIGSDPTSIQNLITVLTSVMNGRPGQNAAATGALQEQEQNVLAILEDRLTGNSSIGVSTNPQTGATSVGGTGAAANPSGTGSGALSVQTLAAQIAAELGSSVTDPNGLAMQIAQQLLAATSGTGTIPLKPAQPTTGTQTQQVGEPGVPGTPPALPGTTTTGTTATPTSDVTTLVTGITTPMTSLGTELASLQTSVDSLNTTIKSGVGSATQVATGVILPPPGSPAQPPTSTAPGATTPISTLGSALTTLQDGMTTLTNILKNKLGSIIASPTAAGSIPVDVNPQNIPPTDGSVGSNLSQISISSLIPPAPAPSAAASPATAASGGMQIGTLQVVITDASGGDPTSIANQIYNELQTVGRYGADTSY